MSLVRRIRPGGDLLLVLLHGYGSDENDLMALAPATPPDWTVVAFRGPRTTPFGGHSWFDLDIQGSDITVHADQALASRVMLEYAIDQVADEANSRRIVVAGFSQGAMLTFGLISHRPHHYGGGAMMSGHAIDEFTAHPRGFDRLPTLIQHGTNDQVVPAELGRRLASRCEELGADVRFHEYEMAHQISDESVDDFLDWLAARR